MTTRQPATAAGHETHTLLHRLSTRAAARDPEAVRLLIELHEKAAAISPLIPVPSTLNGDVAAFDHAMQAADRFLASQPAEEPTDG